MSANEVAEEKTAGPERIEVQIAKNGIIYRAGRFLAEWIKFFCVLVLITIVVAPLAILVSAGIILILASALLLIGIPAVCLVLAFIASCPNETLKGLSKNWKE